MELHSSGNEEKRIWEMWVKFILFYKFVIKASYPFNEYISKLNSYNSQALQFDNEENNFQASCVFFKVLSIKIQYVFLEAYTHAYTDKLFKIISIVVVIIIVVKMFLASGSSKVELKAE